MLVGVSADLDAVVEGLEIHGAAVTPVRIDESTDTRFIFFDDSDRDFPKGVRGMTLKSSAAMSPQ